MPDATVIIVLLAAITLLAGFAAKTSAPYPVVLVLGGLVMGALPGVPSPRLGGVSEETADRLRSVYRARLDRVTARLDENDDRAVARREAARLRTAVIAAERDALARLRGDRTVPTQILEQIEQDLDLEELRMR